MFVEMQIRIQQMLIDKFNISERRSEISKASTSDNLLLEDTDADRLPSNISKLFQTFTTPPKPFDALIALVYNIFLEMGFVPTGPDEQITPTVVVNHPTCWAYSYVSTIVSTYITAPAKLIERQQQATSGPDTSAVANQTAPSNQSYQFTLKLLNFSEQPCLLIARSVFNGDAVCFTMCRSDSSGSSASSSGSDGSSHSVVLPIKQYIHIGKDDDRSVAIHELNQPTNTLTNMKELAQKMKSSIIIPIRMQLMNEGGHRYAGFNGVPQEILWLLYDRFDLNTLQNVSHVSVKLRNDVIDYIRTKGRRIYDAERRRVQIVRCPDGAEPYPTNPYHSRRLPYYNRFYPQHTIYPDIL